MDRKRAAAALLALAACIACSAAAPTASNQTALELMNGPTEGCYYNFQHYGEGDRIMTNEPCLNCTCHNRMLMCYLRVCPFTKPIGQDCSVEKRADQCCPIVTCPDVPVDLLTSTSTSSPAEYGTTGVGKLDKYGCSINGKYFSEGSKVPSTPNKPCEHCYCIRNMTTCVMQECTLHVDGCTPIYHKEVCCPVRYSCDHPEDDILLLDDMTTTVRPTPGFLLTTTTAMPVTQITQDCVHDDQIFPDGTLIKTEKACEHCYCMKGDIVCVVQECGTPMENEGKNCTSLPPRHGQCCPDTYICEGDDRGTELTTEIDDQFTQPPRRVGVEGSGYRNEPDEPFTETGPFETDIEGSGEDYATEAPVITVEDGITEKIQPDIIDEILLATTEKEQISLITEPSKDQNTIPDINSSTESSGLPETIAQATEANVELGSMGTESKTTVTDENKADNELISKDDDFITTESAFRKEDNNIVSDEMLTIKEQEKLPTTSVDLVDETTLKDEYTQDANTELILQTEYQSTTLSAEYTPEIIDIIKEKETTMENQPPSSSTEKIKSEDELAVTSEEEIFSGTTTMLNEKVDRPETTTVNPGIIEVDENIAITSPPGRIPGEGDCLLNGITYRNNTIVPSSNTCHTSCKCTSSIIKCDPIICSSPPEYMENMNDCQPIYDSPDACCPTYVCSAKETIPPQSHSQMSGTESPKPISVSDCNGQDCILDEEQKPISEPSSTCTSVDCLNKPVEKQDQTDCSLSDCAEQTQKPSLNEDCPDNKCQILPVVACEGENCVNEPVTDLDSHKTPTSENVPSLICNENGDCKKPEDTQQDECKDENCRKQENIETEEKVPSECGESECKTHEKPVLPPSTQLSADLTTEKISVDKATEISLNELDTDTEFPVKTISTSIEDNITERPTPGVTKVPETVSSEKLTTISETSSNTEDTTDKTDQTKLQTNQSIPEKSDDTKITDPTNIEHVTESSQDASEDKMTKVDNMTDRTITDKETIHHETSEHTEIKSEDNFTDKIETTTEILEIFTDSNLYSTKHDEVYPTIAELDTEKQKTHTEIPELGTKELEKLTTTEANAIKEVSELYVIKEDKTELPVTFDAITTQTEKISTDFDKATDIYESQVTNKPNEQFVETYTEKEKATETPKLNHTEPHEIITENNGEIADVTPPSESHMTKDKEITTDKTAVTLESNIIPTDLPQLMQTNLDEVTKDVTQEIITDKHETYTEASEQFTTKAEETKSEQSEHNIDNLSTTQFKSEVTEELITEKVTTFTESSETLQTKPEEIIHDFEQTVTEKQEAYTETPEHLVEKLDGTSTAATVEKEIEDTVTEKQEAYTETPEHLVEKLDGTSTAATVEKEIEDTVTEKQEAYTETPEHLVEKLDGTSTAATVEKEIEDTVTEKQEAYTETPEHLVEKLDGTSTAATVEKEIEDTVTEKQEAYTETPEHLVEKLDGTSTAATVEKEIEDTETEKEFTDTIEYYTTEKQEIHTEVPKVYTTIPVELITKDYGIKTESGTELPTLLTTSEENLKQPGYQDIPAKESEEPITEKESHISDDIINTTSETDKVSITKKDQYFTEKSENIVTEPTPAQTLIEDHSIISPTSNEANEVDEQEIDSDKLATTIQNIVMTHEITTITEEIIAVTESQSKSPSLSDGKHQESSTEIQEELPLQTDVNDMDTATQSPQKLDESFITSPASTTSQSEVTTEHYATESQKIHSELTDETQSQLDSSTKPSLFDHKLDESKDKSKPHEETEEIISKLTTSKPPEEIEEIISKPTTTIPQDEQKKVDQEPTILTGPEKTSQDMEKTTHSSISGEEKETNPLPYITESYINLKEKETAAPTTGIIIDEQLYETTEKSASEGEHLPHPTHEYIPVEGITEEITSQTLHDIFTEKNKLQDTFETPAPIDIETIRPELFTKPEESHITETTVFAKEKEIATELPNSYTTPEDLNKISASTHKDQLDENTYKLPESEKDEQVLTTSTALRPEEDKEVTKAPISIVTDIEHITETSIPEKNEIDIESTTKISDDRISVVEKEQTISELYATESQTETSEKSRDEITQEQETNKDKILTTENPENLSTSYLHETTISSFEGDVKVTQQETMTEKSADQTEPISNVQSTSSESDLQNPEGTPVSTSKDEIINKEEQTTTPKSLEDFEQVTPHTPEHLTTISVSKDEITTELSNKEISTIPPKLLEPEKDGDHEVTEIISNDQRTTTMYPEKQHDIVTEKEKTPETLDIEAHVITTETIKPSVSERDDVDIVSYSSTESIPTDKATASVTASKESDILEEEHKTPGIPVFNEIQTSTDATKLITETQEVSETESPTKGVEAIESHYTTVADREESSTDTSDIKDKEPEHNITDDQKLTTTVPKDIELSTVNEDSEIKKSQSTSITYHPETTTSVTVAEYSEAHGKDKFTTIITEDTNINIESTKPTITEEEKLDLPDIHSTQSTIEIQTEEHVTQKESDKITTESVSTPLPNVNIATELPTPTEKHEEPYDTEENKQMTDSEYKLSETTPFLVELEEHTHRVADEITTKASLEEIATTMLYETHESQQPERGDQIPDDLTTYKDEYPISEPSKTTVTGLEDKEQPTTHIQEQIDIYSTVIPSKSETETPLITDKTPTSTFTYELVDTKKYTTIHDDNVVISTTSQMIKDKDYTTESIEIHQTSSSTLDDVQTSSDKDIHIASEKPLSPELSEEKLTTEIPKDTTNKVGEDTSTYSPSHIDNVTKPKEKPVDTTLRPAIPEVPKPEFIDEHNEEIPSPDFPPSGGYGQEPDYVDEDQAFGPGTCRYGGKVYVSAQQIPRDDPCDFCFCFRSDIICLQQSCPPPIHGCHEEPIQGFCCPRYECPVSMATTLNVTTTTTTTTTTLPPHFLPHAYKGAAQRRGCQIKGHTYKVGEVVRASSGPCLHCTCGGDGQMKCDPKACTPEPMLRQMIAAAVSAKRRR